MPEFDAEHEMERLKGSVLADAEVTLLEAVAITLGICLAIAPI
jgi:hypothetical protein